MLGLKLNHVSKRGPRCQVHGRDMGHVNEPLHDTNVNEFYIKDLYSISPCGYTDSGKTATVYLSFNVNKLR